MMWITPMLVISLTQYLECRGSNSITTSELNKEAKSEGVTLGLCSFRGPASCELENCTGNMGNYSRCTCAKNGVFTLCSSRGLLFVPQTPSIVRVLLLDHNDITTVEDTSFQNSKKLLYLDLSYNNIIFIGKKSFVRLKLVETLLLHHNKLKYLEDGLLSIEFGPMIKLKCLRIEQKTTLDDNYDYPTGLQSLQKLSSLSMNGLPGRPFGVKFSKMANLQTLALNGIDGYCNLSRVERETFKHLTQIMKLSLINCNLTFIDNRSFSVLRNLKSLNLSYNEDLHFQSIRNITYSLINLTKFEWLNLTKIHYTFGRCTYLDSYMLQYINQTTVSKLILDDNRLSGMTLDAVDFFPRKLTYFSVSKNKLDIGLYFIKGVCHFRDLFRELKTFESANQNYRKRIGELISLLPKKDIWSYENDVESQHSLAHKSKLPSIRECMMSIMNNCSNCPHTVRPCSNSNTQRICFYPFPFPITPNLETLDFSGSLYKFSVDNICLCKPNNLTNLKLNKNLIYSFPGPFYGFENLLRLDLSENYCQNITEASFSSMTNLRELNLSSNYLGPIIKDVSAILPFKDLVKLKRLDLSNNKLRTIPFQVFSNLHHLKYLSLSENKLSQMDVNMSKLIQLKYLNLSGNLIETFSGDVMEALNKAFIKNRLKINMFANKFTCACKFEAFINWVVLNKKRFIRFGTYYCNFDNGETVYLEDRDILNRLRKECTDYMAMILVTSLCVGTTVIVILSAVLYRYRWRIRYMYYSAKLRYKGYSRVDDDDNFQFDIFVSYADTDKDFVRNFMIPELEDKRCLRLLIHERDFPFGQQVIENIHNAISSSRKTLLFISHGFLQSKWCKYEMNIAKIEEISSDREVICVVVKESISALKIPSELTEIIARNTYLTVPSKQEDLGRFWDTIQCAV